MNRLAKLSLVALTCCLVQQVLVVAVAQDQRPRVAADDGTTETAKSVAVDGARSPALTGARHPLYRLSKSDVLDVNFTFAPEFNQTVSVRPDGFIALRGIEDYYAEGKTVPELRDAIREAYANTLHDPEITVVLKDFDKPYFIASGEVVRPGKYELRGDSTVTEGLAMAGGFNSQAKHSQVVLFRRVSAERVEARLLDVKHMMNARSLDEDVHLKPGDIVFVPQSLISKLRRYLPATSMSTYLNPTQF